MNFAELLRKYNSLLRENQKLQNEINELKEQLGIVKQPDETILNVEDPGSGQLSFLGNSETAFEQKQQPVAVSK